MSEHTCNTCKWWEEEPEAYIGKDWHDSTAPDSWGEYAREPARDMRAVPPWSMGMMLHDYDTRALATLATRATFGCNAWRDKHAIPWPDEVATINFIKHVDGDAVSVTYEWQGDKDLPFLISHELLESIDEGWTSRLPWPVVEVGDAYRDGYGVRVYKRAVQS